MLRDFYLTLPSNTNGESNKTNSYRVNLPIQFSLQGEWEVALSEIFYPNSWRNIKNDEGSYNLEGMNVPAVIAMIPNKNYSSVNELASALNEATAHLERVEFFYKDSINRFAVKRKGDPGVICKLSSRLQYILGFDTTEVLTGERDELLKIAEYPPDLRAGFTSIFVYCNLVAPQVVGDSSAQVLRVVNIKNGEFGENVEKEFTNPHYVPLLTKDFSSVEINIKDDGGNLVAFEYGKVIVKLHFRRCRL